MKFVQGTIKRIAKGEGGCSRLLLERKDGSEFVAVVLPSTKVGGIGNTFKQGGFEAREQAHGRDVYEQVEEQQNDTTVIDCSTPSTTSAQGLTSQPIEVKEEATVASIELAALINLTSQLLQQPIEQVLNDINETYKKI